MKQKTTIIVLSIILAASVGLNLGGIGMFALMRMRARRYAEEPGRPLVKKLELSENQRVALKNAREELGEATKPLREEMRKKRGKMLDLLMKDELDSARRDSLFTEIADLQTEMELIVFNKLFETKSVLDPEQQKLLIDMVTQEFRHGPGMPGPDGPPGPARRIIQKHNQERKEK
ncbi:periplasmic heavy metal sensor [candidate division WOR-3 bacterium]|uniref:Periplasmic heavy metal sensor n=1 Tax=candidate division WOR-3 bacterium TaxID=2052148 RepID=A0A9D5K7Y2_UNCW3|nr:periplasmic heavy metal sensor [candidate division WOR-3 bacterium]MBD3364023.1 periplasmic heavy metal sensor [candidate division WOR-3 bacterium]